MFLSRFDHLSVGIRLTYRCYQVELTHETPDLLMVHDYAVYFLKTHLNYQSASFAVERVKVLLNEADVTLVFRCLQLAMVLGLTPPVIAA